MHSQNNLGYIMPLLLKFMIHNYTLFASWLQRHNYTLFASWLQRKVHQR